MYKIISLIFIALFSTVSYAQTLFETQLDSIQNEKEAVSYIESNKTKKGQLITFNKEKHSTTLAKELFKLGSNGKKVTKTDIEQTLYKIIEKNNVPHYRVSYIYLDGSKKSIEDINKTRKDIIKKYNEGFRFKDLAKHFSMDENANRGGDIGWFKAGDLYIDFENPIINGGHKTDDIFEIDIPEKQWYYVVLKTHDTKIIEEIKVLRITESLN